MIVPDYARPAALMVPYYFSDLLPLFEELAREASKHVGVLLLATIPEEAQAFVDGQPNPEAFAIVAAEHDSPWIRDRSPIPVREPRGVRWLVPRMPEMSRPQDDELFGRIVAREQAPAPILLAHGNLVAGPNGLAFSTAAVLVENRLDVLGLQRHAPEFGIRRWLVFPPFTPEASSHADVHVRFLARDLAAVAWNPDDGGDQHVTLSIEAKLRAALPEARVLRIPVRAGGDRYASPLNWIQLGRHLLVPTYAPTPHEDRELIASTLTAEGFDVTFIESPTLGLGGSLHCLTASIFV